jgi:uncharacterized membrane protein HdeD (DUF308 family)
MHETEVDMKGAGRLLAALVLSGVLLACVFGFLATFEPPGSLGFRILYVFIGLFCLLGVIGIATKFGVKD